MTQISLFENSDLQNIYPPTISELIEEVELLYEKCKDKLPPLKSKQTSYEVWDHVPHLGYRLSIDFWFKCDFVNILEKYCEIGAYELSVLFQKEALDEKYKSKGLEISFSYSPTSFHISTIELKRSKKKEIEEEDE